MADENVNTDIDDWLNDLDDDEGGAEELDQSDIDSLLGSDDTEEEAVAAEGGEEIADELDQSDIDSLLGSGDDDDLGEKNDGTIDQEEMDQLFASSDDEEEQDMSSNEVDFAEILGENAEDELPDFGAETAFDADSFTLEADDDESTIVDSGETAFPSQPDQEATQPGTAEQTQQQQSIPPHIIGDQEPFYKSRAFYGLLGVLVALLLGSGIYLGFFSGPDEEKAINVAEEKPAAVEEQAVSVTEKPNIAPMAVGDLYKVSEDGKEIKIILTGSDAEGAPLSYEVIGPPRHGRLSGNAPLLTYLPNKDFPGEDRFSFRSSDGTLFSSPASIYISGPNLAALKKDEEKKIKKKKQEIKIAAKDISFETFSTDSFVINWLDVWQQSNALAFNDAVSVEVNTKGVQGKLTKISSRQHKYTPPKFYEGQEFISYRFKKDKKYSPRRIVQIDVVMGNHRPQIQLGKMEDQYMSGQVVTIDARATQDDQRNSVSFSWQQLAGVPVQLEARNQEASVVAFVMPSSFYMDSDSGVVMQVTAKDKTGKSTSRDIQIKSTSRRQAALWRASSDGSVLNEPECPYGDCPGEMLPWPYQN